MTKKERKPSVSSGTAGQVADLSWACRCQTWREGSEDRAIWKVPSLASFCTEGPGFAQRMGVNAGDGKLESMRAKCDTTNLTQANVKKKSILVF